MVNLEWAERVSSAVQPGTVRSGVNCKLLIQITLLNISLTCAHSLMVLILVSVVCTVSYRPTLRKFTASNVFLRLQYRSLWGGGKIQFEMYVCALF